MATESKAGAAKRIINKAPGLRYVNGKRILPDDKGIEVLPHELEAMMKNTAFAARLAAGEFEIK